MAKEKFKKKTILIPVCVIIAVILIGILLWRIPIQSVRVTGNQYCESDYIEGQILPDGKKNILMTLVSMVEPKKEIAVLQNYHVDFCGWGQAQITVEEKPCVAEIMYGAIYLLLNSDGGVVGQALTDSENVITLGGIPIISYEPYALVEAEQPELFQEALQIAGKVIKNEIPSQQLDYNDGTWIINIGQVRVLLGADENMDEKLREVRAQCAHYEGLSGTLHMEDYSSEKKTFYFKTE